MFPKPLRSSLFCSVARVCARSSFSAFCCLTARHKVRQHVLRRQCLLSRVAGVCLSRCRAEVDSAVDALPGGNLGDARARKLCSVSLARTVRGYFNSGSAPPLSRSAPGCARRLTSAPPAGPNPEAQPICSCVLTAPIRGCAEATRA